MFQILHLSDLHFGQLPEKLWKKLGKGHSKCAHWFRNENDRSDPTALASVVAKDGLLANQAPDAIVVTGDVGWTGIADDYEEALPFFTALRETWPEAALVVLPGNHDVDRANAAGRQTAFVELLSSLYGTNLASHYPFLKGSSDRALLASIHRLASNDSNARDEKLVVVGINSAASLEKESTPVNVPAELLTKIEDKLGPPQANEFRIFAVHHHLLPFTEPSKGARDADRADSSIIGNSAKLQSWLARNGFSLVLHGHKHTSHGRVDTLWRKTDPPSGRTIVIAGAGSAGVFEHERSPEPLGYNVVGVTRLSSTRWSIQCGAREISMAENSPRAIRQYDYHSDVGPEPASAPRVFHAEQMDDCHAAISRQAGGGNLIRTFISVVDACQYIHPPTCRLGLTAASDTDVYRSFAALHPEHGLSEQWSNIKALEVALKRVPERYQFQHGPRLFQIPAANPVTLPQDENTRKFLRPILKALKALSSESTANAYVSLSRPDIDVLSSRSEPLPSLMSLQFLKDGDYLDLVATFRKIELSFWWVVNMYETIQLLTWAAGAGSASTSPDKRTRIPRRVTFFAALAQWKSDPYPSFIAEIDSLTVADLTKVSLAVTSPEGLAELARLLEEKKLRTNPQNLDSLGLEQLTQILGEVVAVSPEAMRPQLHLVCTSIASAASHIRNAIDQHASDPGAIGKATDALDVALASIKRIQS